uniref:SvrPm3a1f1_F n=1 Tax=Blumeria graminis f. sp. tritici TaxID=62690 RepID=A0A2P0ZED8_BLUGR|nr:SvrPm3a1f1_F [Blumeria graminis f. sp. tritici]
MKIFSIAAVALLVDISVSFDLIDDDDTFRNKPKIPILNRKFGMKCQTNTIYNAETIMQNLDKVYSNKLLAHLEQGSFTRFPGVVFYHYFIGQSNISEQGYYPSNYIIVDSRGVFVAGMTSIPGLYPKAYKVCKFTEETEFATYRRQ